MAEDEAATAADEEWGLDAGQLDALRKLDTYVGGGFDSVKEGWSAKIIPRKTGDDGRGGAGSRKDVYYISPGGERFRSRSEVLRHLNGEPKRPPPDELQLPQRASKRVNWSYLEGMDLDSTDDADDGAAHVSGAARGWKRKCKTILLKIMGHKQSWPFLAPVRRSEAPDYHQVISQPMDFGTAMDKLDNDLYESPGELAQDIHLVFRNACRYNPPVHEIHQMALTLQGLFQEAWDARFAADGAAADGGAAGRTSRSACLLDNLAVLASAALGDGAGPSSGGGAASDGAGGNGGKAGSVAETLGAAGQLLARMLPGGMAELERLVRQPGSLPHQQQQAIAMVLASGADSGAVPPEEPPQPPAAPVQPQAPRSSPAPAVAAPAPASRPPTAGSSSSAPGGAAAPAAPAVLRVKLPPGILRPLQPNSTAAGAAAAAAAGQPLAASRAAHANGDSGGAAACGSARAPCGSGGGGGGALCCVDAGAATADGSGLPQGNGGGGTAAAPSGAAVPASNSEQEAMRQVERRIAEVCAAQEAAVAQVRRGLGKRLARLEAEVAQARREADAQLADVRREAEAQLAEVKGLLVAQLAQARRQQQGEDDERQQRQQEEGEAERQRAEVKPQLRLQERREECAQPPQQQGCDAPAPRPSSKGGEQLQAQSPTPHPRLVEPLGCGGTLPSQSPSPAVLLPVPQSETTQVEAPQPSTLVGQGAALKLQQQHGQEQQQRTGNEAPAPPGQVADGGAGVPAKVEEVEVQAGGGMDARVVEEVVRAQQQQPSAADAPPQVLEAAGGPRAKPAAGPGAGVSEAARQEAPGVCCVVRGGGCDGAVAALRAAEAGGGHPMKGAGSVAAAADTGAFVVAALS